MVAPTQPDENDEAENVPSIIYYETNYVPKETVENVTQESNTVVNNTVENKVSNTVTNNTNNTVVTNTTATNEVTNTTNTVKPEVKFH